jgi:hypothetical protein
MLKGLLFHSLMMVNQIDQNQSDWKSRIEDEFAESLNLPRKKNKRVRKSLQLDYNMACWNPFEI